MVSNATVERLRTEANTILTRIDGVRAALEEARETDGDHWETGELPVTLTTPTGESIDVTLDLDRDAAENAQRRYERAKELEAELADLQEDVGPLAAVPADPRAFRLLYRLAATGPTGPRRLAGDLDADVDDVVDLCAQLDRSALLEDVGAETTPRYRLTATGEDLLDFLDDVSGKETFLRRVEPARRLAHRLWRGGPDYPQMTAEELDLPLGRVRHLYAAMEHVGLVTTYDGSIIKGTERKLKPKTETHRKHTYYVTTQTAERILRDFEA